MAYGKKSYRKPDSGKKYYRKREEEAEEPRQPETREEYNREADRGNGGRYSRGRSGERRGQNDDNFVYITGLFPSESGRAHRIFLEDQDGEPNEEILGKLRDAIDEGKLLGVSENQRGMFLWYIKKDK